MDAVLLLKIAGGLVALAVGVYMGIGRGYTPPPEKVDEVLGGGRERRRVTRHFTPLDLLRRGQKNTHRRSRRGFRLTDPGKDSRDGGAERESDERPRVRLPRHR